MADGNTTTIEADTGPHPFLSGVHTPMSEELTLEGLWVTGKIPKELDGRYMRIGPNPASPPNPAKYHWFAGDGMVHGLRLKDGEALWYRNRWVRSTSVSKVLGEDAAPGPRSPLGDNANTNVLAHAGDTWALVEAGAFPVRLSEELDTVAHDPFGGTLESSFTAHPHKDPNTGELHAICYYGPDVTKIRHVVVGTDGKVVREEPITVQDGPSIHDSMITENYVIILDLPVTISFEALQSGAGFPYRWNPEHPARVGLLPKTGTDADVIWCDVDPCYVFHPCNAYETEDGKIVMHACVHDTMFAGSKKGPSSDKTPFERWTIDPATQSVARVVVDEASQEFPRPDERFMGQPYRYAFTMALPSDGQPLKLGQTRLFKHDLETGTREVHDFGAGRVAGEFVFIPRSDDAPEGEGWMMGLVVDANNDTTDLVILDAADFSGDPVASVHIPHRVPPGFHGNWAPEGS
ncbi:MAG: carotenoid oxygenase family protein [Pseudomonadota bacterium]